MGGVEANGNKHTRKDHALICCSNDELQKKEKKKNSLGGACIRIADRNYVMRTGKRDWREGVGWRFCVCVCTATVRENGRQGVLV